MRIAYVIINANWHEGTSRAVLEVAERLGSTHQVDLWARTFDSENPAKRSSLRNGKIPESRLQWNRLSGVRRPEIFDFLSFKLLADYHLSSKKYDIIHSAGPNTACADIYTVQTVHPIKVAMTQSARLNVSPSSLRRLSWRLYDSAVIQAEKQAYTWFGPRGPRAFLPVSIGTRQELLSAYPGLEDQDCTRLEDNGIGSFKPVTVIPNGADLGHFHPRRRKFFRSAIREQYGLKQDDFVVVFSGGDWRRKGLDLLIEAIDRLRDQRVRLLVVGDDRNGKELRDLVSRMNLSSFVKFAGFQKEVHQYYTAGDLFAFPTRYEAFSLATIEAAASGLPVIMSDASGAMDLLGDGDCGAIVPRDPVAIAEKIMQ
jgi:glycosyltransferase involved in cell wall biosynthesis